MLIEEVMVLQISSVMYFYLLILKPNLSLRSSSRVDIYILQPGDKKPGQPGYSTEGSRIEVGFITTNYHQKCV